MGGFVTGLAPVSGLGRLWFLISKIPTDSHGEVSLQCQILLWKSSKEVGPPWEQIYSYRQPADTTFCVILRGQDPAYRRMYFCVDFGKTRSTEDSPESTCRRQAPKPNSWVVSSGATGHCLSSAVSQALRSPWPWARGHEQKELGALAYGLLS